MHEVPTFLSLLGFGFGMTFANLHVCAMVQINAMCMLVMCASPSPPMCFGFWYLLCQADVFSLFYWLLLYWALGLSVDRVSDCVACSTVLVNCVLNAFIIIMCGWGDCFLFESSCGVVNLCWLGRVMSYKNCMRCLWS